MPHEKIVKSVLNKHKKRDDWFLDECSVNPYEGCNCNCLYYYVRGSKYGENMDEGLAIKSNAAVVLEKQLQSRAKRNQYGIVAVGSATDAYITHESRYRITESFLQLILKYRFPVFISTKTTLIRRDIELLKQIDSTAILPQDLASTLKRGVILSVSISTIDENISAMLEPGAAPPIERLKLVKELNENGFLVGVNAIPLLPFISDTEAEMEKIIAKAKEYGANYILAGGLTLFGNTIADSKTLYYKFLEKYKPDLIPIYTKLYGENFYTSRHYQEQLKERAEKICKKHKIRNRIIE